MRVQELYNQLAHDVNAHGTNDAVLEYKDTDGTIHRYRFIGDRYVDAHMGECGTYVLRIDRLS